MPMRGFDSSSAFGPDAPTIGSRTGGKAEKALEIFAAMQVEGKILDTPEYSSLISACAEAGKVEKALEVLASMEEAGAKPNAVMYNSVITALTSAGKVERAFEVMQFMQGAGHEPTDDDTYEPLTAAPAEGQSETELDAFAAMDAAIKRSPHGAQFNGRVLGAQRAHELLTETERRSPVPTMGKREFENGIQIIAHKISLEYVRFGLNRITNYTPQLRALPYGFSRSADIPRQESSLVSHAEKKAVLALLIHGKQSEMSRNRDALEVGINFKCCVDCHEWLKSSSLVHDRLIVLREPKAIPHEMRKGRCTCNDLWRWEERARVNQKKKEKEEREAAERGEGEKKEGEEQMPNQGGEYQY